MIEALFYRKVYFNQNVTVGWEESTASTYHNKYHIFEKYFKVIFWFFSIDKTLKPRLTQNFTLTSWSMFFLTRINVSFRVLIHTLFLIQPTVVMCHSVVYQLSEWLLTIYSAAEEAASQVGSVGSPFAVAFQLWGGGDQPNAPLQSSG